MSHSAQRRHQRTSDRVRGLDSERLKANTSKDTSARNTQHTHHTTRHCRGTYIGAADSQACRSQTRQSKGKSQHHTEHNLRRTMHTANEQWQHRTCDDDRRARADLRVSGGRPAARGVSDNGVALRMNMDMDRAQASARQRSAADEPDKHRTEIGEPPFAAAVKATETSPMVVVSTAAVIPGAPGTAKRIERSTSTSQAANNDTTAGLPCPSPRSLPLPLPRPIATRNQQGRPRSISAADRVQKHENNHGARQLPKHTHQ